MLVRNIITCGCSFAAQGQAWPFQLEKYVQNLDNTVKVQHLALSGQGNELIQKKTSLALSHTLQTHKPEEVIVIVMWSGVERKSFFIDNPSIVEGLISELDITDYKDSSTFKDLQNIPQGYHIKNNLPNTGGWLTSHWYKKRKLDALINYWMFCTSSLSGVHLSLENLIFLQNLCKVKGVKLFQTFYQDYVFEEFKKFSKNLNVKYLYDMIDYATIVDTKGLRQYLQDKSEYFVNPPKDMHPNHSGHKKWLDEVLIPHLKLQGIFNE